MHSNTPIRLEYLRVAYSDLHSSIFILMTFHQLKITLTAISVYADDMNISVRSGSINIAIRKLNGAIGLLELWFQKWRTRIQKINSYTLFQMTVSLLLQYS
jgi:hypothetical protein